MQLTAAHLRYLLAIYEVSRTHLDISSRSIAEKLGVTKPSVVRILNLLMEQGMIVKEYYGKIYLTDRGIWVAKRVQQELDALIRSYDAGAVLREGVDCAIVGRPNAGKSTLLNLLAGFDRAIVTPVAGTTRDVVEQAVQLGDIRLNLFDTAGLRETEDAIEAEGIRRSWKKLEEAGLILAVFDGSEPPSREDLALAQRCAGRPAIAIVNKEDKPTRFDAELIAPYFAMVLPVCCREEGSRKVIAAAVARLLGTGSIDPHAASLSGQRQLSAALRARDAVAGALDAAAGGFGLDAVSVCVDDALDALCDLTGENASEAVIEQVFERFCVGK